MKLTLQKYDIFLKYILIIFTFFLYIGLIFLYIYINTKFNE